MHRLLTRKSGTDRPTATSGLTLAAAPPPSFFSPRTLIGLLTLTQVASHQKKRFALKLLKVAAQTKTQLGGETTSGSSCSDMKMMSRQSARVGGRQHRVGACQWDVSRGSSLAAWRLLHVPAASADISELSDLENLVSLTLKELFNHPPLSPELPLCPPPTPPPKPPHKTTELRNSRSELKSSIRMIS